MLDGDLLLESFQALLSWRILFFAAAGMLAGILGGALPGLTSSTGLALLLPLTYVMGFEESIVFLAAAYGGSAYGGAITAVLLNIPGTPGSAATALDGYPMSQQGRSGEALGYTTASSFIGGVVGYTLLLLLMRPLADFALKFGPAERVALGILGLSVIGSLMAGRPSKGVLSGFLGLLIGTVGFAPTGLIRGTFGLPELIDGVSIVPAVIGLFAFTAAVGMAGKTSIADPTMARVHPRAFFRGMVDTGRHPRLLGQSSVVGIFIGILPAIGDTVSAFLSYDLARRTSRSPETFGKGNPEGIIATETPDNAGAGGALAITLALGIPGTGSTAIILAAMTAQGVTAGPQMFLGSGLGPVYTIILALLVSQIALLVLGTGVCLAAARVVLTPSRVLVPIVMILTVIGSYAYNRTIFDVWLMLGFGLLGLAMKAGGYSVVPLVLGLVLGPIIDQSLVQTYLTFGGDLTPIIQRPISIGLIISAVLLVLGPKLFFSRHSELT